MSEEFRGDGRPSISFTHAEGAAETATAAPQPTAQVVGPASSGGHVTWALIVANALVFLAMVVKGVPLMQPTTLQLYQWGADFGPATVLDHQWWRLVSACFVHIGLIHIAMNMYVLYAVGFFTERLFGTARYVLLYLLAGIAGNILGLFLHPLIVAAGASGAIFGLYGALLAFPLAYPGVLQPEAAKSIMKSAGIFVVYNLAFSLRPGVDMAGHIGGLAGGFLVGAGLAWSLRVPAQRAARLATVVVVSCLLLAAATRMLPPLVQAQVNALPQNRQ